MAQRGRKPIPLAERIAANVVVDELTGCHVWQGMRQYGYGRIFIGSRTLGNRTCAMAHRLSYEMQVGPIPDGLTLDHLCRNRACVNPEHLEPVTIAVNVLRGIAPSAMNARKAECYRGHAFTPENTYVNAGKRYCRSCRRINDAAKKAARAETHAA